jgi:hypothetical protein
VPVFDDIGSAVSAATRFLRDRQSADGAWRSTTYSSFKDGAALTPLVVHSLLAAVDYGEAGLCAAPCAARGAAYLAALARADGTIAEGPHGLSYPAYSAALTVLVLSHPRFAELRDSRATWLAYLRDRQLTEALGWDPTDREYGGWGYAHSLPRMARPGSATDLLTESNLSATVFALEALRAAGCPSSDPAFGKALTFVCRCQNYADDPEPAFDDGGFFFMYDDPLRNKAGVAGTDRTGRQRFSSYGSMTADGLRALLACGTPLGDARVVAARQWLERHFSASLHPGRFPAQRAALRASIYYYYCWSVVRALSTCGAGRMAAACAAAIAEQLLRRQRGDGSWSNDAVEVREDDPLVATSFALGTLAGQLS